MNDRFGSSSRQLPSVPRPTPAEQSGTAGAAGVVVTLLLVLVSGCASSGGGAAEAGTVDAAVNGLDSLQDRAADDRNARLAALTDAAGAPRDDLYRLGADDLVEVQVFGVEDLSGRSRVSSGGDISLPLLGPMPAEGLTASELAERVEERLRETYMRDPQVSVQVLEMQSHSVSVVGAVNKPGAYQISGSRNLLQVLALAEGLSPEAGQSVMIVRARDPTQTAVTDSIGSVHGVGGGAFDSTAASPTNEPAAVTADVEVANADSGAIREVDLQALLRSGDSRHNVTVHPGDVVQVRTAGRVYVVGDVNQPGGFPLNRSESLSVLEVVAMAEGLRPTASGGNALILRPGEDGGREEIPVDLDEVLSGSRPDLILREQDILFVPNSTTKSVARGVLDAFVRMATLRGLLY